MPRVSVIIPTHNRSAFLRSAIRSVLAQTYQDFELIVVDDASTDDTAHVVDSFNNERITYLRHSVNRRVAAARNTGIGRAGGEFIAFLDDDDEWLPAKLAAQVTMLDSSAAVVGAVYSAFDQVDLYTHEILATSRPGKRGHILHELCLRNLIGTASTVCLRRTCLDEVGLFDEGIEFGEEYDLWIRIAHSFDFKYIDEVLVRYGVHTTRLSTNYAVMISGLEGQLRKHAAFFASDLPNYSRRYVALGALHCYKGDARRARSAFTEAIKASPLVLSNYLYFGLSLFGASIFRKVREPRRGR